MASALLSAAFLSLPLCAQFDNLVTTDDGSTLLFQSQWRLAGSGDGNLSKIYRWDSHGFTTVFSPVNPGLISPPFATSPVITKYAQVRQVQDEDLFDLPGTIRCLLPVSRMAATAVCRRLF